MNKDYLRQAEYCAGMANSAHTEDLRARWLTLSQQWLAMANQPPRVNIFQGAFEQPAATTGDQARRA